MELLKKHGFKPVFIESEGALTSGVPTSIGECGERQVVQNLPKSWT